MKVRFTLSSNKQMTLLCIKRVTACLLLLPVASLCHGQQSPTAAQLQRLLKRFPAADTNNDGVLSTDEAIAYRDKISGRGTKDGKAPAQGRSQGRGIQRNFAVNPGWDLDQFPEYAMCYQTPDEIKATFAKTVSGRQSAVVSFPKPIDGALRVVGVGHSFMAPGYKTLPVICQGDGMKQPLYTHTGGGMTGSARYKWEQENGIFQFDGKPVPKLLASISNGKWDAMMFGPYYNDRPEYYACWIDFCLKYNPDMKFYLSDAWPQLEQLSETPDSEDYFTPKIFDQLGAEKRATYAQTLDPLREAYPGKIFVLPTSDAMVLAAKHYLRGELPGIEGLHRAIGNKERSLWRDRLGHLGPGLERLEGYVFYATLYGKSPERIESPIPFGGNSEFPSSELDQMFRSIAWRAVRDHPYSGVVDHDDDGVADAVSDPPLQESR